MINFQGIINSGGYFMSIFPVLRHLLFAVTFVALALLINVGQAAAQGTPAQREGCEGDAFKFCSNYIPFVHAIENCLYRNMRKLTPACRFQMQGGTSRRR
jgi:hypothetical protein